MALRLTHQQLSLVVVILDHTLWFSGHESDVFWLLLIYGVFQSNPNLLLTIAAG